MNSKGDPKKDKDDLLRLARELDGVIEDNHLGVFDKVCAETVSRVRNELIRLAAISEPQGVVVPVDLINKALVALANAAVVLTAAKKPLRAQDCIEAAVLLAAAKEPR